jgi:hypothetical protein
MRPEQVFRVGSVQASVFKNEFTNEDGSTRSSYSVNLHRRYRDRKTDEWKWASIFRLAELPQAEAVLRLAFAYVAEREATSAVEAGEELATIES